MNVKEYYMNCIRYEQSSLAHYIHHLLGEKKISLEDDESNIDLNQANHEKVAEMIRTNLLGFHKMGIYSLKMNQRDFYFIFAESDQEAIRFFNQTFHQLPLNCHEYPLDFEFTRGNGVVSFRDMRKEFTSFPALAGYYKREWSMGESKRDERMGQLRA